MKCVGTTTGTSRPRPDAMSSPKSREARKVFHSSSETAASTFLIHMDRRLAPLLALQAGAAVPRELDPVCGSSTSWHRLGPDDRGHLAGRIHVAAHGPSVRVPFGTGSLPAHLVQPLVVVHADLNIRVRRHV